ncbi:hypothetical protein PSP31121_05065 [Pandoraea sputorum]|uniref:Uncharacterized protein n=2 Tax=Pandoraea sputorum TaxID=93222 RepID=A0A5E5BH72_9BURK|nr:hypothetical protein PSP31121_05065 [Pandoraea sputorum]
MQTNNTAAQGTATEESRPQLEMLRESIKQYENARIEYTDAEKEVIELYDRPPNAPPNENDAAVMLRNFREKFEIFKETYERVLATNKSEGVLGDLDESAGGFRTIRPEGFEYDFISATQFFEKNLVKLALHTGYYSANKHTFETVKSECLVISRDVKKLLNKCLESISEKNSIDAREMKGANEYIKIKLTDIESFHKHLLEIYIRGVGFDDEGMDLLGGDYRALLITSEEVLTEIEKILLCAREDSIVDYTSPTGAKKTLILDGDGDLKRVRAKIAGAGLYEGGWKNDKPEGDGALVYRNGNQYEGAWSAGVPHGWGKYIDAAGNKYQGELERGVAHGWGVLELIDGSQCEGNWAAGDLVGAGVFYNSDRIKIDVVFNNRSCIDIAEGKENLHCFYRLMLGAADRVINGYVEVALRRCAKVIENSSLHTTINLNKYADYQKTMLDLVDQAHKRLFLGKHERMVAWDNALKVNGRGILFDPNLISHSIKIEILPPVADGGRYAVTIFNAGSGLNHHNKINGTNKFETRLTVYFDAEKINYLQKIFVENIKLQVKDFYNAIIDRQSFSSVKDSDAHHKYDVVHQTAQIAGNCMIESWMAVFKNKAAQMHGQLGLIYYNMFRNDLMKLVLNDELEKIGRPTQNNVGQEKVGQEKVGQEKVGQEKVAEVIAQLQERTTKRIEKIKHDTDKSNVDFFMQTAEQLYPGEQKKQATLMACIEPVEWKNNLDVLISGPGRPRPEVLLASAFSKYVKRKLKILGLES